MDYTTIAKDLLGKSVELKKAYASLGDEIAMLDDEKYSVNSAMCEVTTAKGGGSKYEEYLTNLIFLYDNAVFRRKVVARELKMIENGKSVLDDYEKDLIDLFYIRKAEKASDFVMEKYHKERSGVYEDARKALGKFTRAVYGVIRM